MSAYLADWLKRSGPRNLIKEATDTFKQANTALSAFECLCRAIVRHMEEEEKLRKQ